MAYPRDAVCHQSYLHDLADLDTSLPPSDISISTCMDDEIKILYLAFADDIGLILGEEANFRKTAIALERHSYENGLKLTWQKIKF